MVPALAMTRWAIEPRNNSVQCARRDGATMMWVKLLVRAYSTTAVAGSAPGTVTVSPPRRSASRMASAVPVCLLCLAQPAAFDMDGGPWAT